MKPLLTFDETLLDNQDQFKDPFFDRYQLRHAEKPLQLNEQVKKNYLFPTFYSDVTCAIGIFMCNYKKAEEMMFHPAIKPVRMTKDRALIAFSCYIYKNVLGIPPYYEIAMSIPVLVDPGFNPPVVPMVAEKMFKNFGYYVFSMPVTSLENRIRGNKIWGLPKVVQEIDITENSGYCTTIAKEENGAPYFELSIPMNGQEAEFDVTSNLYTTLEGEILQSETNFKSRFHVNKNMKALVKANMKADYTYLKIGDSPSGQILKNLEIEEMPFQTRFTKGMVSSFDLPNPNYKPSISLT
ncbi:acetoacetate decarboxylase family protein [Hazenella sp. IB182353]|uniref:acetoacetate decarboxylase family protein n=1 Tax=Polycladospora coralii TaxID=2771432 RepID=UPI00174715D6|nr:acetoacetate decarboxylase family protein [Polycladospora coralii]MBS7529623.1 acetoacetate decarboxylase family protein [Polycladospora coralii]